MSKKKQTWVSPSDKGWKVQHEDAIKATKIFETQKEAIDYGRQLSKNMGTEFIVQWKGGKIRIKDSHWNDSQNIPW